MHFLAPALLGLLPFAQALTAWQQRNFTASVPTTPSSPFAQANYSSTSDALAALASALGGNATIAYPGDLAYGSTVARVWTEQRKTYPDAIVYPSSAEQVSILMQFYSAAHTLWADGFAVMCGGHADFGGAQSPSVIIDLQDLGATEILANTTSSTSQPPVLKIGGGAEAGDVYDALDGTGWAFLGPRAASIGVGGFLLGGGIAFQTSRYGVAVDSVVGLEVVLVNGTIVYASPHSAYSDIFWAAAGGGWLASVGVVTAFYTQAYPDPGSVYVGTITWAADQADQVFDKAADWWETNTEPDAVPALVYYFKDASQPSALVPIKDRAFTLQLNAMYFGGGQAEFNASFGRFYEGASTLTFASYSLKTLDGYLLTNYPYGYHREFYGKSHTNSTAEFYQDTFALYQELINGMLARGEDPGHTLWVDEFEFRGWNGAGPTSDADTAWPHSTSGHITLTSGEWSSDNTTAFMHAHDNATMAYLRDFQSGIDEPTIYDYPNYIVTNEVWGAENYERLLEIKQKYDPGCLLSRGRVPATEGCVSKGLANTFL